MKKYWFWLLVLLDLIGVLMWRASSATGEIGTDLVFGWAQFMSQEFPKVHVRWDGVAIFAVSLILATTLAHWFLSWLTRESQKDATTARRKWRLRWTLMIMGTVVLMFAAGISMVGATHEAAWLLQSKEPLLVQDYDIPSWPRPFTQLEQMSMALHNSEQTYGTMPTKGRVRPGEVWHSWVTYTLDFLQYMHNIDLSRSWDDPTNAQKFKLLVPVFLNPEFRSTQIRDSDGYGLNHYAGNTRIFDRSDRIHSHQSSKGSNTFLVGEVNNGFVPWGQPENSREPTRAFNSTEGFGGADGRGASFVMLDGSVRRIDRDIDPRVLEQLSEPRLNE